MAGFFYLLKYAFGIGLEFKDTSILLTAALFISIFITVIFFTGFKRNEKKKVLYTLSAISLKFVLFFALLGVYVLISENLSTEFFITFFMVYLAFTFYLLLSFIKVLKPKKL
jgi:hypothetical protein